VLCILFFVPSFGLKAQAVVHNQVQSTKYKAHLVEHTGRLWFLRLQLLDPKAPTTGGAKMFTNLIESHSHRQEFKRRSSFFLATVAGYSLIIFAALVVGVLTYDARVDAQNADLGVDLWIPPVTRPPKVEDNSTQPPRRVIRTNAPVDPQLKTPMRTEAVAPITDPTKPPDGIGTKGSDTPPVEGPVTIGPRNADPQPTSAGSERGCDNCSGSQSTAPVTTPPTVVEPVKQPPRTIISEMIASKAVSLPKPDYPRIAREIRAQGPVNVQILVDETGKVISAHAVKGNPALIHAAEEAARRARFTPTVLNNQPVKVQGVITYNFSIQ